MPVERPKNLGNIQNVLGLDNTEYRQFRVSFFFLLSIL